jgi:hypothetical protein
MEESVSGMAVSDPDYPGATPVQGSAMTLTLVSLKAFGDFVIACQALRRIAPGPRAAPGLIAASHLRPLASAIGFEGARFIDVSEDNDVPAAFDIRRRGMLAALRSLVTLRRHLSENHDLGRYMFDRIGWRERFMVSAERRAALPEATNIYKAYEEAFEGSGYRLDIAPASSVWRGRTAVIVPASRLPAKTIPSSTIEALAQALSARGIVLETVLLEGDAVQVPASVTTRTIPRRFPALVECLRAADLVISADSLAAHLAEFFGVRCFVVSPQPNRYWLPASCLHSQGWCLFDDVDRFKKWLDAMAADGSTRSKQAVGDPRQPL